jgi:hypothetical protein
VLQDGSSMGRVPPTIYMLLRSMNYFIERKGVNLFDRYKFPKFAV